MKATLDSNNLVARVETRPDNAALTNLAEADATCGVRMTLSIFNRGLFASGGSCSSTSSPAAAIQPSFKALISAGSSVVGPRPVLMKMASGFISRKWCSVSM